MGNKFRYPLSVNHGCGNVSRSTFVLYFRHWTFAPIVIGGNSKFDFCNLDIRCWALDIESDVVSTLHPSLMFNAQSIDH